MRVTNPIMQIDMPDIDIIRVNDMYYMVSTTMFVTPGAPVLRSGDLVHWEIIPVIGWKREKMPMGRDSGPPV